MSGLGAVSVALLLAAGKAADPGSPDLVEALLHQNAIRSEGGDDAGARPPAADAPLDLLVAYWRHQLKPAPPDVAARLLVACERDPAVLPELLKLLPETDGANDRIKAIWDQHHARLGPQWSKQVVTFLMGRSRYFRDDLEKAAAAAHDEDGYIEGRDALEQLARLDWTRAAPLLTRFAADRQRRRATLALALTYKHQVATGGPAAGEELRAKLKAIVAGKRNPGVARDVAFGALAATDWPGRDEWFLAQFADPTLREMHDDVLAMAPLDEEVERQPDKWIPIVTRLLGNPSRAVHDAAVSCLVQFHLEKARADALRPLLPWLANPRWSSARDRLRLIQSVDRLDMKESVPGLIAVVGQAPSRQHDASERSYAAESLAHFRDPRAVPALRKAIAKEKDWDHLRRLYRGLVASGGVSADETVSALEALARQTRTPAAREAIEELDLFGKTPLGPGVGLGLYLSKGPAPDEPIVRRLVERARELERTEADTAAALRAIFDEWKSKPADQDIARRLDEGRLSPRSVWAALYKRASLRRNAEADLRRIASRGDGAAAVAAVLLGDAKLMVGLLGGNNADAQAMLLVCARLTGDKLPLDRVSALLGSKQGRVAEAAAGYLRADDSPQARRALLASGGKAQILGNRTARDPGHVTFSEFDETEQRLRRLVLDPGGPDEILALLSAGYWGGVGQVIVSVKGGKARLDIPVADNLDPLLATPGGVLVVRSREQADELPSATKLTGPERPEYFLVDPGSKRARKIEGDFRPIPYNSRHPFQPAGPDQIWAVTSEAEMRASLIGRYDLRRFVFTPVMELPGLLITSGDIWVDEAARRVYAVYGGHLLRFPLKP